MAIESYGTLVEWNNELVGEVISISGPGGSTGMIDTTHLTSTAKEKLPDLRDEGQVTLEVNWLPDNTGQGLLRQDRADREKRTFRIYLTDTSGTILTGDAYCTGYTVNTGVGQQVRGTITMEIDGAVNYSPRLLIEDEYSAVYGTVVLTIEEDTFAAGSENTANWAITDDGSNLDLDSVVKDSDTQVTLTFDLTPSPSLVPGSYTLRVQALAAALTGDFPSGSLRLPATVSA